MLGERLEPELAEKLARRRATLAHSTAVAGSPGSRSKAITVGRRGDFAKASEGCSSSAASWASQTRVARSSQTMKSRIPSRSISIGSVRTQSGVCLGARFS